MTPALIAVGVALAWGLKQVLGTLLTQQVKGCLPEYTVARATAAAKMLPSELRAGYLEDWLAELGALDQKPLSALRFSGGLARAAREISALAGVPVPAGAMRRTNERLIDISTSAVLLGILAPCFSAVVVSLRVEQKLLRLERRQPVFDISSRVGRGGRPIRVTTFRTRAWAPSRPTRVGAVLERSSFDQIPKLVNVLRGELSLIGPPAARFEASHENTGQQPGCDVRPGVLSWEVLARVGVVELMPEEARRRDRNRGMRSDFALLRACVLGTGRVIRTGRPIGPS